MLLARVHPLSRTELEATSSCAGGGSGAMPFPSAGPRPHLHTHTHTHGQKLDLRNAAQPHVIPSRLARHERY